MLNCVQRSYVVGSISESDDPYHMTTNLNSIRKKQLIVVYLTSTNVLF